MKLTKENLEELEERLDRIIGKAEKAKELMDELEDGEQSHFPDFAPWPNYDPDSTWNPLDGSKNWEIECRYNEFYNPYDPWNW